MMLMPSMLPHKLFSYQIADSDEQLFDMLANKPPDLLSFFVVCCEDETWVNLHSNFTKNAFNWITENFYLGNINLDAVKPVVKSIREHFQNLQMLMPLDLFVELSDRLIVINSLLFQTASPYWYRLIRTNCFEKDKKTLRFSNVTYVDFEILKEYAYTGEVKELYRLRESEIFRILHLVRGSEFTALEDDCEELLLRYITPENLLKYLALSEDNAVVKVRQRCCELFNSLHSEVEISSSNSQQLSCEFKTSTEYSRELFEKLIPHVTQFIAGERVMEDPAAIALLQRCPKLVSLDVGRTRSFTEHILFLSRIKELIFVGCVWLTDVEFKKICAAYSSLQKLDLTSCAQVTLQGWGELTKLPRLVSLSLARCEALSNDEFCLILLSARHLRELKISECRSLGNQAFHALATAQQRFVSLDLGRTAIEDQSLLEITTRINSLSFMDLTRCQNLSEQGIVDAIKVSSLQEVNLAHTNISASAIEELKRLRPSLKI